MQHSNFVTGTITAPTTSDLAEMPKLGTPESQELEQLGLQALKQGQCAMVVLAGGMATRMGGVVKALVEALPGHRFWICGSTSSKRWNAAAGNGFRCG